MSNGNPDPPPARPAVAKRVRSSPSKTEPPRNWRNCTLRTAAGIGLGSAIFGLNSGPRGIPLWGLVGLFNGLLVTSIVFGVASLTVGRRLTNDRLALLGGACGYISVLTYFAYMSGSRFTFALIPASGIFSLGAMVGGWIGCLSATEPGERKRLREKVARLSRRRP